jgi:predicted porin
MESLSQLQMDMTMNKKLLALAISGAVFGTQAVAVELYNEDGTAFSVGGHVSVNLNGSEKGDTDVGTNSPRINFNATQELGNGFTADAKGEWALNYLNGGDESFTTRLGYVGLTHDELGRAVAGTQWAPYYDVASATDMPIAFANDFLYDNHGALGTGRADKMASYRNGFDFGEAGELSFGLGWQGSNDVTTDTENVLGGVVVTTRSTVSYDDRIQATLGYSIAGVKLGYAFNTGDFKEGGVSKTAESHLVSAAYGSYGSGLYLAGIYASNENMNVGLEESDAYELLAAYALANSLNLSVNYEVVEGEATKGAATQTDREELALQAEYNFTSNVVGYTGYQFDLNDADNRKTDDKWTIGARFYL